MSAWISVQVVGAVAVTAGLVGVWLALRATERQRDEWRGSAAELAKCVRVDAWPLGEADARGFATIPMPTVVVVVGPEMKVHDWTVEAAVALHRYDTLVEPEGAR